MMKVMLATAPSPFAVVRLVSLLVATLAIAACGGGNQSPGADAGTGWTHLDTPIHYGLDVIAVGSRLVASGQEGIAVSDDDGATWAPSNTGFAPHNPDFDLLAKGSTILADAFDSLYLSTDRGGTWTPVAAIGLPSGYVIYTSMVVGTDVLVGLNVPSAQAGISGALFRTYDEGVTFSASSTGLPQDQGIAAFAAAGGTIYCALSTGVGQSTDDGNSWVLNPLPTTSSVFSIATMGGTVLAGTSDGILYASPDGANWSLAGAGLPSGGSIDVLFTDALYPDTGKVYASILSSDPAADSFGVYVSSDAGASWTALNDGFDAALPLATAFAVKDGFLFANTATDGVWRRPL